MPQPISIPPLIPLPANASAVNEKPTTHDAKDDLFATLFSPSTPRASPTFPAFPDEDGPETSRPKMRISHSRTSSVDSDFGSFVSVPSAEDPLHQVTSESVQSPFTPLQNFEFFGNFTEEAKAATAKNKQGVLDELLNHEADPLYFLRSDTPTATQNTRVTDERVSTPAISRPSSGMGSTHPSHAQPTLIDDSPGEPLISLEEPVDRPQQGTAAQSSSPRLVSPANTSASTSRRASPNPSQGLLQEILTHEDDPMYFHSSRSANTSRTPTPQPHHHETRPTRSSRHPSRESNWTEPPDIHSPGHLTRTPSLPPTPMQPSQPEVQKTQSFFTPSSFTASSFPTRWVSSLLSRPAPPARPATPPIQPIVEGLPIHTRAATVPGATAITHGTPFAAHTYTAPSGAPGFAGDRAWNKGFEFDGAALAKAGVQLIGRREGTHAVLTGRTADTLRPHLPALQRLPRKWTLLYSLDQHGISLGTLYAKCGAHSGGALFAVRDANDAVFGAWMGEGVHVSKGAYYGSGESFLWKTLPDGEVQVFKWTGRNDYVALCELEYLSFGGGDGHYGLYLDSTLSDGSSARCPTFNNDPLCSAGPRQGEAITFECVGLEVWGVGG